MIRISLLGDLGVPGGFKQVNPNTFQLAQLKPQLKPFRLYFYPRLRSTNDHAARLRRARKLYAPAIVLTPHQMKGRGRGSNSWWSGEGSLTITFCLPTDDKLPPHHVPLITGLAVREAIAQLLLAPPPPGEAGWGLRTPVDPQSHSNSKRQPPPNLPRGGRDQTGAALHHKDVDALKLKWPNDLWHDDLKLAGILCERIEKVDLVGLGLNVNVRATDIPNSLRHRVTSLQAIAGRTFPMPAVVIAIARQIERRLLNRQFSGFGEIVQQINRVHALTGRRVRITEPGESVIEGLCEGLDADGRLLVRTPFDAHGSHRVVAGHVELLS